MSCYVGRVGCSKVFSLGQINSGRGSLALLQIYFCLSLHHCRTLCRRLLHSSRRQQQQKLPNKMKSTISYVASAAEPTTVWQTSTANPTPTISMTTGRPCSDTARGFNVNFRTVTSPPASASRHVERVTDAYRLRYAAYLASTFHISVEAANVEAAFQL